MYICINIYMSINLNNQNFVTCGQPFLRQDQIGSYMPDGYFSSFCIFIYIYIHIYHTYMILYGM